MFACLSPARRDEVRQPARFKDDRTAAAHVAKSAAFRVAKLSEPKREVYGWASVSIGKDGTQLLDLQDDLIDPSNLEDVAHDFVLFSRAADVQHSGEPIGELIEACVVTPEKLAAMGLQRDGDKAPVVGFWCGFRVNDETFARVKSGELSMFSIAALAEREEIA